MPRRCCVPGCTNNYDSKVKINGLVTTFSFPRNEELRQCWIRAIPRKDWRPSQSAVVCADHFNPSDIIKTQRVIDTDGVWTDEPRKPKLKDGATPVIFPNLPQYLSKPQSTTRTDPADRLNQQEGRHEEAVRNFMERDLIKNYDDLLSKTDTVIMQPWKKHLVLINNILCLYLLELTDLGNLSVKCSVIISENMSVKVFVGKNELSPPDLSWILPQNLKLSRWSQLENILARYNNHSSSGELPTQEYFITKAIHYIEEAISVNLDHIDSKLSIVKDQLSMMINVKRHYSMITILFAFCMYCQSSSSYNLLRNHLFLPTKRYLQYLSSSLNISPESNKSNEHYLSHIIKTLDDREKYVNILVDEIYIKSGLNYKSSTISGYAHNNPNTMASTVQTFMISSAFGHFTEIVKLLPVKSLSGNDLKDAVLEVILFVQKLGFHVTTIITDNNRVNQKLFSLLSSQYSMANPQYQNHEIYLLFDFVHIFKNIRNNWLNLKDPKKTFIFPDFHTNEKKNACFQDFRDLYEKEKFNVVKKGYKLNNKSLFPNSLERQNVLCVDNIFHHSTIAAIKSIEQYNGTASFLEIIRQWWDVVNCKSTIKGKIKLNTWSCPVYNMEDLKLNFLKQFVQWLEKWDKMTEGVGFTRDTFSAIKRSTHVIHCVINDALTKLNMKYVLIGKFQTDCLEKRFGRYRSLSGCNYNLSYTQVVESEKKIRIQHILKKKDLIKEFSDGFSKCYDDNTVGISDFMHIITESNYLEIFVIDEEAKLYVCGYVAHSVKNKLCCELYENSVVKSKGVETDSVYFNYLQRGGLSLATDSVCVIFYHLSSMFEYIINDKFLECNFLKHINIKGILYQLTKTSLESDFYQLHLIDKCQ